MIEFAEQREDRPEKRCLGILEPMPGLGSPRPGTSDQEKSWILSYTGTTLFEQNQISEQAQIGRKLRTVFMQSVKHDLPVSE